jgi:hypothetical protein
MSPLLQILYGDSTQGLQPKYKLVGWFGVKKCTQQFESKRGKVEQNSNIFTMYK